VSPTWLCAHSGKPPPSIKGLPDHEAPPPKPREMGSIPAGGRGFRAKPRPRLGDAQALPTRAFFRNARPVPKANTLRGGHSGTVGAKEPGSGVSEVRRPVTRRRDHVVPVRGNAPKRRLPASIAYPEAGKNRGRTRPAFAPLPLPPWMQRAANRRSPDRESPHAWTQYLFLILPQVTGSTG
jgi:hypothetical protein